MMRINAADLLLVKWNRPTTKGKAAGKRGTSQLVFPKKSARVAMLPAGGHFPPPACMCMFCLQS